jgi:hypothetical protein
MKNFIDVFGSNYLGKLTAKDVKDGAESEGVRCQG